MPFFLISPYIDTPNFFPNQTLPIVPHRPMREWKSISGVPPLLLSSLPSATVLVHPPQLPLHSFATLLHCLDQNPHVHPDAVPPNCLDRNPPLHPNAVLPISLVLCVFFFFLAVDFTFTPGPKKNGWWLFCCEKHFREGGVKVRRERGRERC